MLECDVQDRVVADDAQDAARDGAAIEGRRIGRQCRECPRTLGKSAIIIGEALRGEHC